VLAGACRNCSFPDAKITGISTEAFIRNMSVLIRSLQ
jgi:hypothetical protein